MSQNTAASRLSAARRDTNIAVTVGAGFSVLAVASGVALAALLAFNSAAQQNAVAPAAVLDGGAELKETADTQEFLLNTARGATIITTSVSVGLSYLFLGLITPDLIRERRKLNQEVQENQVIVPDGPSV